MTELAASNYKTITFDCYGTLIDWENGILGYLQPLLESYDVHVVDDWVLDYFAQCEPQVQAEGGSYRSVLGKVLARFGTRLAFTPNAESMQDFANSIEYWQPYPDTVPALRSLASQFSLAVISNIDNDLFVHSAKQLGVDFASVTTAQDAGVYKPDRKIFQAALKSVEGPVLHVAQSTYHDIAPASQLGLDTVWIERPGASSARAAKAAQAEPTWSFPTLADFAEALLTR